MIVTVLVCWLASSVVLSLAVGRAIKIADDATSRTYRLTLSVQEHAYAFIDAERRERGMLTRAAIARTAGEFVTMDRVRGQVEPLVDNDAPVLTSDGRALSRDEYFKMLEDDMAKMDVPVPPILHPEGM